MTTADYALIISILSLLVSLGSFVWSVWSKFLHPRPKISVAFNMSVIYGGGDKHEVMTLSANNFGPGHTSLKSVVCRIRKRKSWWRLRSKLQYALLNPLDDPYETEYAHGPFAGGLPAKIDVGENFTSYLIARHAAFRDEDIIDVGFADAFGRYLWAKRSSVARVRQAVREAYIKQPDN